MTIANDSVKITPGSGATREQIRANNRTKTRRYRETEAGRKKDREYKVAYRARLAAMPTVIPDKTGDFSCKKCLLVLSGREFYWSRIGQRYTACKQCCKAKSKKIAQQSYAQRLMYSRQYEAEHTNDRQWARQELRLAAIRAYGGRCACCGEDELVFLAIDHINGNGAAQRKDLGNHLSRWLRNNNFPGGYQVLCHNCNWAKYRGGCPHHAGVMQCH